MPIIDWLHYADLGLDPICRSPSGSINPVTDTKGSNAKVVVFSGTPLRQPVHWQGPMALASADALADRIAAYQRGEFGTI